MKNKLIITLILLLICFELFTFGCVNEISKGSGSQECVNILVNDTNCIYCRSFTSGDVAISCNWNR